MSPSYSKTKNKQYRYYISQAIKDPNRYERGQITKISAGEIEQYINNDVRNLLDDTFYMQAHLDEYSVEQQKLILKEMNEFSPDKVFIRTSIKRIDLQLNFIKINYDINYIIKYFATRALNSKFTYTPNDEVIITRVQNVMISVTPQKQNKIIIPGKANYDMKLIQAIVKSFWYNKLGAERKLPPEARNGNNKRLRKLRFLPPEIIESIMNGTQDPELNVKKLIEMADKCCK